MEDDIRARMINAAKTLFGRYGFRKTSLADIAAEARRSKSAVYHYFASKAELFHAVVNAEMEVLWQRVREAVTKAASPQAKLKAFVLTRMRMVRKLANAYATLHEDYLDQLGFVERFREQAFQSEVRTISGILRKGVETGAFEIADVGLAAHTIAVALKGLEYPWMVNSQEARLERDVDLLLGMLMKAIKK
ncbi:MAG: TetR/AcrR family transcriptional regulator [Planctomycetes bacterium]|nr:TetR/AcrR family transcriptional regulator [Planctomycetota bacterium]